ncbi:MAG: hypothetical protein HFH86_04695 [Bacilli bacterium]|jgi:predicted nucleic acid-binding Zn ribbon protein|nr:hypothetical protein [Bacilli bacterium]
MKKDRNTFFEGSSMNMSAFNTQMPQPMMQPMPGMMPMNASASASQSFYANTGAPMMMPMAQAPITNDSTINELESRMAKLERNLNRLENRVAKLEGSTYYTTDSYESSSSGMYMV